MRLGYERIVKDKRISIETEDSEDPWVLLKMQDYPETIRIKASDATTEMALREIHAMPEEISKIIDAVHQAYIQATTNPF